MKFFTRSLAAGERGEINYRGRYLRLHSASEPLFVKVYSTVDSGFQAAAALMQPGQSATFDTFFNVVEFEAANANEVEFYFSDGRLDFDGLGGSGGASPAAIPAPFSDEISVGATVYEMEVENTLSAGQYLFAGVNTSSFGKVAYIENFSIDIVTDAAGVTDKKALPFIAIDFGTFSGDSGTNYRPTIKISSLQDRINRHQMEGVFIPVGHSTNGLAPTDADDGIYGTPWKEVTAGVLHTRIELARPDSPLICWNQILNFIGGDYGAANFVVKVTARDAEYK